MSVTIYHNPACGTSRGVLEIICNSGWEPEIIEYLKTPPAREKIAELLKRMDITARDLMRTNVEPYETLNLADPKWTDEQLVDFMAQHPILINRPVVVTPLGVRLCRPKETVLEILGSTGIASAKT